MAEQLLQLGILGFGLLQDGDVGVGVFPECQEVFVGIFRSAPVSRQRVRPAQLQVRQRPDRIAKDDPAVIENFLEFGDGIDVAGRGQTGLTVSVYRIEIPEEARPTAGYGEIIGTRDL